MNLRLRSAVRPLAVLLALIVPAAPSAWAGPPSDSPLDAFAIPSAPSESPVTARLVTTSNAVEPGATVLVGVHLAQKDGWHTYWKNSGDAGLPTEIRWELPEGWSASEILWPAPYRYVEAGDLTTFGYSNDPVLLTELTAPAGASGPATIRAKADWLMCKELCIPGAAELEMTLQVGGEAAPVAERDLELIAASRARLPQAPTAVAGVDVDAAIDLTAVPPGQSAMAALVLGGVEGEVEWFPEYVEGLFSEAATPGEIDGNRVLGVPFELEPSVEGGQVLDWGGVIVATAADGAQTFLTIDVPVRVAGADDAVAANRPELFATLLGAEVNGGGLFDQDFSAVAGAATDGSLAYFLLLALVGGLILNVMPCVLPVLSLKVMGFVAHAGEHKSVQFKLGLMFAAGVLASFLVLAAVVIALQAAGDQLGWGFQFQNPVFVLVMAAVVFAFGLSLFGVYEIVLPIQMGGGAGKGSAYAESFMNGVLATALATPCTAPLLGTALGFAFTQSAGVILAIFLTVGLGLSLPYVILALNPRLLRFVPKPGAWMDTFKQGMGFLLMATLIWLLWVLGQQVGTDGMIAAMIFILVLGFALWMYGRLLNLSSSTQRRVTVWAVMIALIAGAWWQFVHEPLTSPAVAANTTTVASHGGEGTAGWEKFSVAALEREVMAGNTVFIDFTAAWCTTCKVNEKTVIMTEPVLAKLEELGVKTFVGDWTNRDEEITRVLRQFGRSGVPFYAVFPAGRLDSPIVLPEIITQGLVIDALEQAGPSRTVASR